MSGIGPRLSKAAYDPLMNPGDVADAEEQPAAGSLMARARMPVEELRRMALSPQGEADAPAKSALFGDDDEDVPAQKMSDFLAGGSSGSSSSSVAASALFDELDPAQAEAKRKAEAKKRALFNDDSSDDDIELTDAQREEKAKKRAAARAEAKAKAEAAKAAAAAAATDSRPASPVSPSGVSVNASATAAALADASAPAALSAASKRAGGEDLFGSGDQDNGGERSLQGVFIPSGAAQYRTAEERMAAEDVDPALLAERDDSDLQRLGGTSSAHMRQTSASQQAATVAATPATTASAAAAVPDEDLDDDLFSFSAPRASPSAASSVDPSAPGFDINSYIAAAKPAATTSAGLFDDSDDEA